MKHLPLLLLLPAALGFAAEEAPRPRFRPDQGPDTPRPEFRPEQNPEARPTNRLPVPLSPDEQKRLRDAMQKAQQDPAVKEAHEQAAKAQQAAVEAQKKAREVTDDAARKADPEVGPILEKLRKAMEPRAQAPLGRQPSGDDVRRRDGGDRQPEAQPRGEAPRAREPGSRTNTPRGNNEGPRNRDAGRGQPEAGRNQPEGAGRGMQFPGLTPDEQQRVREAIAKANSEPAVREAREAAAAAQRKAMEVTEDAARKADPSVGPLFEKIHKAAEARRPEGEGQAERKAR